MSVSVPPIDLSKFLPLGPQAFYALGGPVGPPDRLGGRGWGSGWGGAGVHHAPGGGPLGPPVRYHPSAYAAVARMFSGGFNPGGLFMPGVPTPAAISHFQPIVPSRRSLSEAGQATSGSRSGGFHIENFNVHNPVPERTGESLTRATNRLAFLAGRGLV